jgi:hypothetical protein
LTALQPIFYLFLSQKRHQEITEPGVSLFIAADGSYRLSQKTGWLQQAASR